MLPVPVGTQQGTSGPSRTDGRPRPVRLGLGRPGGWRRPQPARLAALRRARHRATCSTTGSPCATPTSTAPGRRPARTSTRPVRGRRWSTPSCSASASTRSTVLAIQAVIGAATAALLVVVFRALLPGRRWRSAPRSCGWCCPTTRRSRSGPRPPTSRCACCWRWRRPRCCARRSGRVQGAGPACCSPRPALCYEAVIPLAAVLIVVVPWVRRGRPDWPLVAAGAVTQGAVALWIVTHWHPAKHVASGVRRSDPGARRALRLGHRSGRPGGVDAAAGRARRHRAWPWPGSPLPSLRSAAGPGRAGGGRRAGRSSSSAPIPFAKYLYAPLGRGDRFNFVSAIGGALVWAGLAGDGRRAGASRWRWPAVVVLVAAGCYARVERAVLWHRAAPRRAGDPAGRGRRDPGPPGRDRDRAGADPAAEHRGLPRPVEHRGRAPDRLRPPRPGGRPDASARSSSTPIRPSSASTSARCPSCEPDTTVDAG